MRQFQLKTAAMLAAVAGFAASAAAQTVFYSENFDSAVLTNTSGDPRVISACVVVPSAYTHVPPTGWTRAECGVSSYDCRVGEVICPASGNTNCAGPDGVPGTIDDCTNNEGVREWEGWSFTSKAFWGVRTDDQGRTQFALATGNVAVADPDEWDDRGDPDNRCGFYNTFMTTPNLDISSITSGSLALAFHSSWQPEGFDDADLTNNQTAIVKAIYNTGEVVEVLHWDSDNAGLTPGDFFHASNTNESVALTDAQLQVPAGATSVRFEFSLTNAGNDWWWAIDNVVVAADVAGTVTELMNEGFEGVTLGPALDEGVVASCGTTYCNDLTYTHNGPNGISTVVNTSGTGGVPDWKGWSFVEPSFWVCADNQRRAEFVNATGKCAVADSDEYDDVSGGGFIDMSMSTPSINIAGRTSPVLVFAFDSSWRNEQGQTASVTATFNDGTVTPVFAWDAVPGSPNNKATATNERAAFPVIIPVTATSVVFTFNYTGSNNWWWAVDNLSLFEGTAVTNVVSVSPSTLSFISAPSFDYSACWTPWSPNAPAGWSNVFSPSAGCPAECGRPEWRGWAFPHSSWWPTVDDQTRSFFTLATGFIAVADPDEWDDFANAFSTYNTFLTTPDIALSGPLSNASLSFASSWRPEGFDDQPTFTNNQTAIVNAIYTVGGVAQAPVEVLRWDSDENGQAPGEFFHPDNQNEAVSLALSIPAGATAVRFEFNMVEARNDWWWAIDNVNLEVGGASVFFEDFEDVPGKTVPPSENPSGPALCSYYSSVAAQNNGFTATGTNTCFNEFSEWGCWLTEAWAEIGGGRGDFAPATAFVSDFQFQNCDGTHVLTTATYNLNSINENSVVLSFASGWFEEAGKSSTVEVSFDNGATWTNVLTWNTANKDTNTNEVVSIDISNPAGATSIKARFTDVDSGWWAISNISITGEIGTPAVPCPWRADGCFADFNNDEGIDGDDVIAFFSNWDANIECADVDASEGVDGDDVILFFAAWDISGTGFPGC